VIVWAQVDPGQYERAVQMLLNRLYPGVRSLDGSGGDGGQDATWVSDDGVTVFEMKSFTDRLTSTRRRQVEKSLRRALENAPGMTRWELIVPLNMTPERTGAKSSEQSWFEGRLAAIAGDVKLEWRDRAWLDFHFAQHADLREYVEGPTSEVLRLAKEARMEEDILADGAADLAARNLRLRGRVDAVTPYWTLDWQTRGNTHTSTLRAKHPQAPELDPIRMTPTFQFSKQDPAAVAKAAELDHVLGFGGTVDVPGGYITDFLIETSPETLRLLGSRSGPPEELSFVFPLEPFERPLKAVLSIHEVNSDAVVATLPVYFRARTGGHRGVTLHGSDAAELLTVTLALPRPDGHGAAKQYRSGKGLELEAVDNLVGVDTESLLPVLNALRHISPGHRMVVDLPDLASATSGEISEVGFKDAARGWQIVADLHRLGEHNGRLYKMPADITVGQETTLRWAVTLLDGRIEADDPVARVDIDGSRLREFLAQVPEEIPGGMFMRTPDVELLVGDLQVPYGPAVRWWAPPLRIRNRAELEELAASGRDLEDTPVGVEFESLAAPSVWMSHAEAVAHAEGPAGGSVAG